MKLVVYEGVPHVVLRERDDWGVRVYDLVPPPRRLWADSPTLPPALRTEIDPVQCRPLPSPAEALSTTPPGENWISESRRGLARLEALALIAEDPQRRFDAREVVTLAHQVSLVRHILDHARLRRVLIADEVGLGKTVEAGLLVKELLAADPGRRVLYLAPARLVSNVAVEFRRLGLPFREWKAVDSDANLATDDRIIASIHRAVHPSHRERFITGRPWDIVIVDECHHLTDWAPGGGDPVMKYRLVRDLIAAQSREGFVILLSGTPHQANAARFNNLLRLLRDPAEDESVLAGRVIFRTKDDVRDWDENPLFPRRQVNHPILCDVGDAHRDWLQQIHRFFAPQSEGASDVRRRAAGWRCAQALQWAASSPNAGLGYLVRQAIRDGWDLREPALAEALAVMRPYRLGSATEPPEQLLARIRKEVQRQEDVGDVEDIEDELDDSPANWDRIELRALIRAGAALVASPNQPKWEALWREVIANAGGEKIVLFAQPIETVLALARWLEERHGQKPSIIIGGQSDAERLAQVQRFSAASGPQLLISSRAGGEGINLQFARRLVHLDVPWNPMDMEQRVGRVHRFGSVHTILVDTLIVRDSREGRMWAVARQRLEAIARAMVAPERFESLFSRVMCLVPAEELQAALLANPVASSADGDERLHEIVDRGFTSWQEFHQRFSENQRLIRKLPAGIAGWADVEAFLLRHAGAAREQGVFVTRFRQNGDAIQPSTEPAPVLRLKSGLRGLVGDFEGSPLSGELAGTVVRLGLNLPAVASALREASLSVETTGAVHLRWTDDCAELQAQLGSDAVVHAFLRQRIKLETTGGASDLSSELVLYAGSRGQEPVRLDDSLRASVLRILPGLPVRSKLAPNLDSAEIEATSRKLSQALAAPSSEDLANRTRPAVWPILVAHIVR